ncbi:MAG: hypothetical protein JXR91_07975 [Deltaproteobacteria bacterium]|nr:hypothetical protein [Deltaproteobacteria bacterium]
MTQNIKYIGVVKDGPRYRAKLHFQRYYDLGRWPTAEDAAVARDRACLFLGLHDRLQVSDRSIPLGKRDPLKLRSDAHLAGQKFTSNYRGVCLIQGRWVVSLGHKWNEYSVGSFPTERDAAIAYDRMVLYYKDQGHPLNFPENKTSPASVEQIKLELKESKHRDSKFHGVFKSKTSKRRPWQTLVYRSDKESEHCGMWITEEEAAFAHDRAALHVYNGNPPILNFPERELVPMSPKELCLASLRGRKALTSSQYVGVHFCKGAWVASICVKGKMEYISRYYDEELAARVRDKEARKRCGPKTKFNFPPDS